MFRTMSNYFQRMSQLGTVCKKMSCFFFQRMSQPGKMCRTMSHYSQRMGQPGKVCRTMSHLLPENEQAWQGVQEIIRCFQRMNLVGMAYKTTGVLPFRQSKHSFPSLKNEHAGQGVQDDEPLLSENHCGGHMAHGSLNTLFLP